MDNWPAINGVDPGTLSVIRNYCGWHIAPPLTETVRIIGESSSVIILPTLHLTAINSVRVGGQEVRGFVWTASGILYMPSRVNERAEILVEMVHGFDTLPASISDAATRMKGAFEMAPYSSVSVDGVAVSGSSLNSPLNTSGMDSATAFMLSPYRRPGLP